MSAAFEPLDEWLPVQRGNDQLNIWANRLGVAEVDVYAELLGATGDPHGAVTVTFEDVRARQEEIQQYVLQLRENPSFQAAANKFLGQFKKLEPLVGTTTAKAAYDAALLPRRRQQLIQLVIAACEPFCVNDEKLEHFDGFVGFDWAEQQNVRQSSGSQLSAAEWERVLLAIRQRYPVETQADHMAAEFGKHVKQAGGEVHEAFLTRRSKDLAGVFGSESGARAALLEVLEREGGTLLVARPAADTSKGDVAIKDALTELGLELVDKRSARGGRLWVVGDLSLKATLERIAGTAARFVFVKDGGRATRKRPGWYLN